MSGLCFIQSGTKVLYGMGQISPLFYTYIYFLPQSLYSSSTLSATRAPSLIPSCYKDFAMLTTTSGSIALDSYQFRRHSCSGAQFHCKPLSRRHGILARLSWPNILDEWTQPTPTELLIALSCFARPRV